MKLFTIKAYEHHELSPKAFDKAHEKHIDFINKTFWDSCREITDPLKKLVDALGFRLDDYEFDTSYSSIKVSPLRHSDYQYEPTENLSGRRAFAWVENHLLGPRRIPWVGAQRWKLAKYNAGYRSYHPPGSPVRMSYSAGRVKPCPLTGYCYDDDYIEALHRNIRSGLTLQKAIRELANVATQLLSQHYDDLASIERFKEDCNANNTLFLADGSIFRESLCEPLSQLSDPRVQS